MTEAQDTRTIAQRLHAVMVDVPAVEKSDRNDHQKFLFRGIDAVLNRIGPALRANGVVVLPKVISSDYKVEQFGSNRTAMGHVQVLVEYTFVGLMGDSLTVVSAGEATDSGDKATAKAMSVAYRTALLQTFCLPTDEPDPDSFTYERSAEPQAAPVVKKTSPFEELRKTLLAATDLSVLEAVRVRITDMNADPKTRLSEKDLAELRNLFADQKAKLT